MEAHHCILQCITFSTIKKSILYSSSTLQTSTQLDVIEIGGYSALMSTYWKDGSSSHKRALCSNRVQKWNAESSNQCSTTQFDVMCCMHFCSKQHGKSRIYVVPIWFICRDSAFECHEFNHPGFTMLSGTGSGIEHVTSNWVVLQCNCHP